MAWIEFHQSLREHPKLYGLALTLSAKRAHLAGHLGFLWLWSMDYALDGDLTKFSDAQIAGAAGWEENPQIFVQALVKHGFIDQKGRKRRIHDWFEFCGEIVKKRLSRRKERRTMAAESRRSAAEMPPTNQPTVPDLTNQTNQHRTSAPDFASLWQAYPNKDGRKAAERSFKASVKTEDDWKNIQIALKHYLATDTVKRGFIKSASTWFANWKDWIDFNGYEPPKPPPLPRPPVRPVIPESEQMSLEEMERIKRANMRPKALSSGP